jgi:hypothetical protein
MDGDLFLCCWDLQSFFLALYPAAISLPSQQQLLPSTFFPPCTTSLSVGLQNLFGSVRYEGEGRAQTKNSDSELPPGA